MSPKVIIEAGPLTLSAGLFFRFEWSGRPLALVLGPLAVMWTPSLPGWSVRVQR